MTWLIGFLLSTSLILCQSAHAQDALVGDVWNAQMDSMIDYSRAIAMHGAVTKAIENRAKAKGGVATAPPSQFERLRFSSSPEVSRRVKAEFTRALVRANPQATEEIERTLGQQDVIGDFARDMKPYGLRADHVGDAMTAYWITMWMVANQQPAPDVKKVAVVQRQIGAVVVQNSKIANSTDSQRQEIGEALIYETMLAFGMLNGASGDAAKLKQLADDAQRNMLKQGINMRGLKLTADGFTPRL